MLHLALYEPEIPPNTGNIARSCAATGTRLHLIGRLGFQLDERSLRRAGIDYWPHVDLHLHADFDAFLAAAPAVRVLCIESTGAHPYTRAAFQDDDCLLFGNESKGLPPDVLARYPTFHIPMPTGHVRSLNLATAAGIVLYEALRQRHGW